MTSTTQVTPDADADAPTVRLGTRPNPASTETSLPVARRNRLRRLRTHYVHHRTDYVIVALLAVFAGVVTGWNLAGYPTWFTDEGTYVSQSWAVMYEGQLANYTYWYDHPPAGWLQLSIWSAVSGALHRQSGQLIVGGREFMVVCRVATAVLVYILMGRLGVRRSFSVIAVMIFVMSPLAIEYGRYVLLDNIAMPWLLAAFILVLSPKCRLTAVIGAGFCAGMAFLSKETSAIVIVVTALLFLWHSRSARNKVVARIMFFSTLAFIGLAYFLYAALKTELFPGPGHVSLLGSLDWQLFVRKKNGSILDPTSDAFALAKSWFLQDKWLASAGIVAMFVALPSRKLWAPALALAVQVAMMMRNGYLPYPYVIGMLPFAAMLIGGVADALWPSWRALRLGPWYRRSTGALGVALVLASAAAAALYVVPAWHEADRYALNADTTAFQRQAVSWVDDNVPRSALVITEGAYWLDFRTHGFERVTWREKLDVDPAVMRDIGGPGNVEYMVLAPQSLDKGSLDEYPTLAAAVAGSEQIASFGEGFDRVVVMRRKPPPPAHQEPGR